ncbi:hypothetical protein ACJDU8_08040 [Clostridium sp. WILCCON 0269]|uniref:Cell division protein FtsL n=1 Tax=Candidatus Clostridium eludens TaxID=3381663 RepID=A0ABW8SHN7_9CLOT
MIVINEKDMINGNTVLQPEYKPYKETEEKKYRHKKTGKDKKRNIKVKKKLQVIRNIGLAFTVGLILVYRYSIIYDMQTELNSVEVNISEVNRQNENLKVDLVKYNNLQYIENSAINKLHMVVPNQANAAYVNLDKQTIKTQEDIDEIKTQKGILNKLKQLIWR